MDLQLPVGDGPERRPLRLLALEPLPPLLGAVTVQFFPPADLPFLEHEIHANPFLQAPQRWPEPVLNQHSFPQLALGLTSPRLPVKL